ncbi:MAG: regulatory protein RecX [Oscillospiraceae bacterium]|jgi:regulatory protein|nr:regulatory protein RecX [Oscillospiraceae bacterium]
MRVEEVKKSQRKQGRFLVRLEDGGILRVTEDELLRFGLREGLELGEEELEALRASAKASRTKAAAARMIGSRALSKQELTRRLMKKGSDAGDAQAAADWLEEIGAVDDENYAAALVRHYGGKGYGPARVRDELRRRGVDRGLWDSALEEMPEAAEILDHLLQKRGDLSDPKERRRASDALLRRGFSWEQVRAALGRYAEMEEDEP